MSASQNRPLCRFYLVRHGETEWNVQGLMQGSKDSPLTKDGVAQAQNLSKELSTIKFDLAFSSDMMRAQTTAKIIAADRDLVIKTSRLLREASVGQYEGKAVKFFLESLKSSIEYRQSLSEEDRMSYKLQPELESYNEVAGRALRFLKQVALAHPNQTALVVSHAGTIRSVLLKLGHVKDTEVPHGAIKNSSYVMIESDGVEFFVRETKGIEFSN